MIIVIAIAEISFISFAFPEKAKASVLAMGKGLSFIHRFLIP
jgi:hypothetical protein